MSPTIEDCHDLELELPSILTVSYEIMFPQAPIMEYSTLSSRGYDAGTAKVRVIGLCKLFWKKCKSNMLYEISSCDGNCTVVV
jgi:hypothetical protein